MNNAERLQEYVEKQLNEMCKTIETKFKGNMENRKHNPFNAFDDKNIVKYMMLGRSFDSQLGNRLQKIAMASARMRYGDINVPNILTMYWKNEIMYVNTVSFPLDESDNQKIHYVKDIDEAKEKLYSGKIKYKKNNPDKVLEQNFTFVCSKEKADEIRIYLKIKSGTPVDLLHIEHNCGQKCITTYEMKAGGNLDTKNTDSNRKEVERLADIFSIFDSNYSFFATCYNNNGEGNVPSGDIFKDLPEENQIIGKKFWENILPSDVSYKKFISIYSDAFENSKIEEKIRNLKE